MKLTPAQWLAKEPERVKWTHEYLTRKGFSIPPFLSHNPDPVGYLDNLINRLPENFFKNIKSAYAKAKSTEKHAKKTFNVTLDAAAFGHLKSLSGNGSMQAMIRRILSDLGNSKRLLEAELERKEKHLEKKYGTPRSLPPRTISVDTIEVQELINYFSSLVNQDLYELCRLRYLHERAHKSHRLTHNQIQEIDAIHEQKMSDLNNLLSQKKRQSTIRKNIPKIPEHTNKLITPEVAKQLPEIIDEYYSK